jgi:hypothetical protein
LGKRNTDTTGKHNERDRNNAERRGKTQNAKGIKK